MRVLSITKEVPDMPVYRTGNKYFKSTSIEICNRTEKVVADDDDTNDLLLSYKILERLAISRDDSNKRYDDLVSRYNKSRDRIKEIHYKNLRYKSENERLQQHCDYLKNYTKYRYAPLVMIVQFAVIIYLLIR